MRTLRPILFAALVFIFMSPDLSATSRETALGPNGEYYRIQVGTYGQFFSAGLIPAANSVLVLEIHRAGSTRHTRILVPGTEADEIELAPAIAFEEASNSLILIWSSQWNFIHSKINFALFSNGSWSPTIELSGDVWSRKSYPSVAVMSDRYFSVGPDGPESHLRTVYNVAWWEQASSGDRVVYSPVTFVDGRYIGWNPTFALTDLGDGGPPIEIPAIAQGSYGKAPTIQPGDDASSALITFVHPIRQSLVTFQLQAVDGEIALLASQVAQDLLNFLDENTSATPVSIGEYARPQIVDFGARLGMHPGVTDYIGSQLQTSIRQLDAGQVAPWLADYARPQIVDFGLRMSVQGLTGQPDSSVAWLMEFEADPIRPTQTAYPPHSIRLRLIASRSLPPAPTNAEVSLLVSRDGQSEIAAWQVEQEVQYVESQGTGWSELRRIQLGPHLSTEQAFELLATKLRNRS